MINKKLQIVIRFMANCIALIIFMYIWNILSDISAATSSGKEWEK